MEIWGLDLETSGSELDFSATIQVGLCHGTSKSMFCYTMGGWSWVETETDAEPALSTAYWHPVAAEVHGIAKGKVESSPKYWHIDPKAEEFVLSRTFENVRKGDRWVVGWNVRGFDMPFVYRDLPMLGDLFSRRSIDLNAVTAAVVGKPGPDGSPWTYRALKTYVKARAEELARESLKNSIIIGEKDYKAHNAGFDAVTAVHSFEILQKLIAA